MKIDIMTLFPQMFSDFTRESIIGKAIEKKIIDINLYNIRNYADNKAHHADDYTYGGGNGMLMLPQPIYDCHKDITKGRCIKTYYLSPKGKLFNQKMAIDMSKLDEIIFLCGHYEGVDERALELIGAEEVSIGDYVLTGGELPCMVIIDSVARFIDGVLSNDESANDESFINNLLEYPQYTRPASYEGLDVPEVLISGDHKKVAEWRLQKSIEITKKNRPDLYKKYIENN